MTPERYRQVNALADAALQMKPEQRGTFLDEVCGSDRELRKQIQELLDSDSCSGDFLEKPVLEVLAGDMLARPAQRDLAGKRIENYEVISRLGAGGIGEVWLARDLKLDREIALKLLSPRFAGDPYHVRRFQQEARAASTLNHPNIITVYEIGETDGALFIAEERVAGETIRQRLALGPFPIEETLEIGAQAAAALDAAHAAGVVHRDIKPENVMIRPDGLVKLLDFGLARFVERPVDAPGTPLDSASLPGMVLGTVRYMSPEQARGLPVDGRSDIFSLGVMLYEMAAGMPPFSGSTPTDTLAAILTNQPAPLSRYLREAPEEFERIVLRSMAKDPAKRYASAGALKQDLTRLAERLGKPAPAAKPWRLAAAMCAVLAATSAAYFLMDRKEPTPVVFNSMQITRLATHGEAADAAISPNGKLLAYVVNEGPGQSVWIRDTSGSSETAAVPPQSAHVSGLTFSPDGVYLYYRRRSAGSIGDLYRVRVKGGAPELVEGEVSGAAAFSPDGRRIAFVRLNASSWDASLIVSNADGREALTVASVRRPRYLDQHSVAWAPDGRSVACFAGEAARYSESKFHLVEVRLADGSQRTITKQSWAWPRGVAWSAKGNVLIVTAATRGDSVYQLWMVRGDTGAVSRLTNDLSDYDRVTFTNDGRSLATVQTETAAAIWVSGGEDFSHLAQVSATPLHSAQIALAWTPDGHIVYSDPTGGYRNLWRVEPDGKNRKQITFWQSDKDQIVVTPDGRYILYKQAGNIWRMDADGTNARQLTHGSLDVHPDASADGRSVVYASFADWSPAVGGQPTLWRVPVEGGEGVEISRQPASYPRESPDGRRLGCVYFPGKDPRVSAAQVAMMALDGSKAFTVFDSSVSDETSISWSPGGKALDYIVNARGVGNIWRQPVDGKPAKPVTKFDSNELFTFAWSRDGHLACARGATTRGVVLIENFH